MSCPSTITETWTGSGLDEELVAPVLISRLEGGARGERGRGEAESLVGLETKLSITVTSKKFNN